MANLCESCTEAFRDEGAGDFIDDVAFMGADIPDHCCDVVEIGPEVECECGCRSR